MLIKQITVDSSICCGCRACEMTCSFAHFEVFSTEWARIRIAKDELRGLDVPMVCQQCAHPACQRACPENAIIRNPQTGHLDVDSDLCIGCKRCGVRCPHLAITYVPDSGHPLICNLCHGAPECVLRCPTGAIRYESINQFLARLRFLGLDPTPSGTTPSRTQPEGADT